MLLTYDLAELHGAKIGEGNKKSEVAGICIFGNSF